MPLSQVEIAQCDAKVLAVVREDIGKEIAEYYASAVFFGDHKKPEQPNNEIRNALNHLARAYQADTFLVAETDFKAADRHIVRAKRDSLKLAIIGLFSHLSGLIRSAEYYYGSIPPGLVVQRSQLISARADAYRAESNGDEDTTERLQSVYLASLKLLHDLQDRFPAATRSHRLKIILLRLWRQAWSLGIGFSLGVTASLVAAWVWDNR